MSNKQKLVNGIVLPINKKNKVNIIVVYKLTHTMAVIEPSFTWSEWNLYLSKITIFGLKMMVKSGLINK